MPSRKVNFVNGEFYHIYNRGVDKRRIFLDKQNIDRFFQGMHEFNVKEPIGSLYENSFRKNNKGNKNNKGGSKKSFNKIEDKLVNFVAYCLNPNHYHLILEQISNNGIEKFLQRIGTGYTKYFNNKNYRNGVLFQGPFKAVYINSNEYLLHLSVYINLNSKVHALGSPASKLASKLIKSSWEEYMNENSRDGFCKKDIILDQFKNRDAYKQFAESSLLDIIGRKKSKELTDLLLE